MKRDSTPIYLKRFAWGAAGGSLTGLQNFLKDSLTILKAGHGRVFPWYLFFMVLLAIATAFSGLLLLTACMKRYNATFSAAMFVGSFVISASVMSACHYHTFENLEKRYDFILYPLGLVILMVGIYVLVQETEEEHELNIVSPTSCSGSHVEDVSTLEICSQNSHAPRETEGMRGSHRE